MKALRGVRVEISCGGIVYDDILTQSAFPNSSWENFTSKGFYSFSLRNRLAVSTERTKSITKLKETGSTNKATPNVFLFPRRH